MPLSAQVHECSRLTRDNTPFLRACLIYTQDGAEIHRETVEVNLEAHQTEPAVRAELQRVAEATKTRLQDLDAIATSLQGASF